MTTAVAVPSRIDFPRLTTVELRKMVDTRAGFWLLLTIQLLAVGTVTARLLWGTSEEQHLANFFDISLWVTSAVLPVLGILAVTSEWSQRTGLTTFALVPRRERVIGAKLVAAALLTLTSVAVCLLVAASGNAISGGSWSLGLDGLGEGALFAMLAMAGGFAFGLAFMNSALAITLYFLLPTAWTAIGETIGALREPAEWLDLDRASEPLLVPGLTMTGTDWAQLATAAAVWVGLFLAAGLVRLRRTELK
jgi:ABC-2 type transport system permease protein